MYNHKKLLLNLEQYIQTTTQYNCNITAQYKLHRKSIESSQEWMGRLQTKAAECEYKEYHRLLTEQFKDGLNDEGTIDESLKEVVIFIDIGNVISEHMLIWNKYAVSLWMMS